MAAVPPSHPIPVTGLSLPAELDFQDEWLDAMARGPGDYMRRPNLPAATFAAALLDNAKAPIWMDDRLSSWVDQGLLGDILSRADGDSAAIRLTHVTDSIGAPLTLILAPLEAVRHWPVSLPNPVPAAARRVAIAVSLAHLGDELVQAGRAFGMSNLEARLAAALVRHGTVRQAAAQCNVTYETARTAVADAIRKARCSRQPQLVAKLTALVAHIEPNTEHAERVLADLFDLRQREARLALLLTEGNSRRSAAQALGISEAVAKTLFARIFEQMGVTSAPEASRLIIDAMISAYLVGSGPSDLTGLTRNREPLHFVFRPDGSQIAYSDFGPRDGEPVLLIHPGNTTRHPPRSLVKALIARGYRPIAIDRPGFGLSDLGPESDDPFADSARDADYVVRAMGIDRLHILVRSTTSHAHAAAARLGARIAGVLSINADLCAPSSGKREGLAGVYRNSLQSNPNRIESILRWMASQISAARVRHLLPFILRHSPADVRAMRNEELYADYERTLLTLATGRISGWIREQRHYLTNVDIQPLADAANWTMLIGRTDPLDTPEDVIAYWTQRLPGAEFRIVEDGGRLLHFSHLELVLDALDEVRDRAGRRPQRRV